MKAFWNIVTRINITAFVAVMLFSCENPYSVINKMGSDDTLSGIVADSVVYFRSDSGIVKMEIRTPRMVRIDSDEDVLEFPLGFVARMFDNNHQPTTIFQADYGKNYGKTRLIEALGNVSVENFGNRQTMYSDKLYWYQGEKMLFTRSHVRIVTPDKEIEADSLMAKEDFSEYTMYSGSAVFDVDEEE